MSTAEFDCDCGAKTQFDYQKPEMFRPRFVDVKCRGCDAVWTIMFRSTSEGMTFTIKLSQISQNLADILNKKAQHEFVKLPKKTSPIFTL